MSIAIILEDLLEERPDGTAQVAVYPLPYHSLGHQAALEWARFHGLEPNRIPAGSVITRNAHDHTIRYLAFVEHTDGEIVVLDDEPVVEERVEQGEAGPLPYPAVVTDLKIRRATRPMGPLPESTDV